jgi:hypothetical protein
MSGDWPFADDSLAERRQFEFFDDFRREGGGSDPISHWIKMPQIWANAEDRTHHSDINPRRACHQYVRL